MISEGIIEPNACGCWRLNENPVTGGSTTRRSYTQDFFQALLKLMLN